MPLNTQAPSREAVLLKAMDAAKKAKDNQTTLTVDVEIKGILGIYPDSPLSPDELASAILKFCGWVGVPAQLNPPKSRA